MIEIELNHLPDRCHGCDACEIAFRQSSNSILSQHPGIKALARTFDVFRPGEWRYIAVPVLAGVKACKHDALIIIERGSEE